MSSFSCPHLEFEKEFCIRLNLDCVPGRKGCVLKNKYSFALPVEERIKIKSLSKRTKKHKKEFTSNS